MKKLILLIAIIFSISFMYSQSSTDGVIIDKYTALDVPTDDDGLNTYYGEWETIQQGGNLKLINHNPEDTTGATVYLKLIGEPQLEYDRELGRVEVFMCLYLNDTIAVYRNCDTFVVFDKNTNLILALRKADY